MSSCRYIVHVVHVFHVFHVFHVVQCRLSAHHRTAGRGEEGARHHEPRVTSESLRRHTYKRLVLTS